MYFHGHFPPSSGTSRAWLASGLMSSFTWSFSAKFIWKCTEILSKTPSALKRFLLSVKRMLYLLLWWQKSWTFCRSWKSDFRGIWIWTVCVYRLCGGFPLMLSTKSCKSFTILGEGLACFLGGLNLFKRQFSSHIYSHRIVKALSSIRGSQQGDGSRL